MSLEEKECDKMLLFLKKKLVTLIYFNIFLKTINFLFL